MFSRIGQAAYKPGLDTSLALDRHFGHPHRSFKSIHVAGTNGKGSTSHSLAAILQSQGYKTGLYTSPHLVDFRERIRINGEMISHDGVTDFVNRYRESGYSGHPSFFELTMMMAFDWFARNQVDYAVIEVGMGGRLDSTNIITPVACVITNISRDHTQFLGDTLVKIASEKAGIIKPGIPVTIGEASGAIREVFARKAAEAGASVRYADENTSIPEITDLENVSYNGDTLRYDLRGDYQKANLRTVLTAVEMLRDCGINISREALHDGLESVGRLTGLTGRWSRIAEKPLVIADTGHNEAGLRYNMEQLRSMLEVRPKARLHLVIGFVADKDVEHILPLFPKTASYHLTQAHIPRAMDRMTLQELCRRNGIDGTVYEDVASAYQAALDEAHKEDIIYVGGSTFIVADLLEYLRSDERPV